MFFAIVWGSLALPTFIRHRKSNRLGVPIRGRKNHAVKRGPRVLNLTIWIASNLGGTISEQVKSTRPFGKGRIVLNGAVDCESM